MKRYHVGTSKHWQGDTVFWQTDSNGRIRTDKIILYNSQTDKRVKQPFCHVLERVATDEQRKQGLDIADFLLDIETAEGILERMRLTNQSVDKLANLLHLQQSSNG